MKYLLLFLAFLFYKPAISQERYDTVKVMVAFCDTLNKPNHSLAWDYAYSVRILWNYNRDASPYAPCHDCEDYWKHIKYLSISKRELRKGIVIWYFKDLQ